jgi:pantoate--beta-alanine ligase
MVARDVASLRAAIEAQRADRAGPVGFVPTMGALHAGHAALVQRARTECDVVVASIFVNPTQFNDPRDLAAYPRTEAADLALLAAAGCDVAFVPTPAVLYPEGFATHVEVGGLTGVLEGAHRPGHFRGVATVVTLLLRAARPDRAFFGEKDWQQLQVIRRLARDLLLDVDIVPVPTVRDADGLALSSRNARLDAGARARALALPHAIAAAQAAFAAGERNGATLERVLHDVLARDRSLRPDYAVVADPHTLRPVAQADATSRVLLAVHVDGVRLIDNAALGDAGTRGVSAG